MNINDYTYNFPPDRIAKYPPKERGTTNLLVLNKKTGEIDHKKYSDLPDYFEKGDILILNDTKVIKARLEAKKENGTKVEIFLLEKHIDDKDDDTQKAIYRGRLEEHETILIHDSKFLIQDVLENGIITLKGNADLYKLAKEVGQTPIPPYLKRESEKLDEERYQTEFAKNEGSVAAPTASLNFTNEIKQKLNEKGVEIHYLTLHVGLGTFMPIREDDITKHKMHEEFYIIPEETVEAIRKAKEEGRRITAIGTTVTRALEHAKGKILNGPNTPKNQTMRKDLSAETEVKAEADIFIYPGYEFKIIDRLITNFHAPRSTVLMLTAAFAGWDKLKHAYEEAVEKDYKFLSYGDSMLIE